VEAHATGEQAVAVGVLDQITGGNAAGGQRASNEIRPHLYVVTGVADGRWIAGGAARRMYTNDLFTRHSEHAKRIVIPQVELCCERQAGESRRVANVARLDAGVGKPLAIEGNVGLSMHKHRPQTPHLCLAQLVATHALVLGIPVPATKAIRIAR
jgi:hypothetical protein